MQIQTKYLYFQKIIELSWIFVDHLKNKRERKRYQFTGNTSIYVFSEAMAIDEPQDHMLHSFISPSVLSSRAGLCPGESAVVQMIPHPIFMTSALSKHLCPSWAPGTPLHKGCFACHSEVFQTHWMAGTHYHFRNVSVTFPSSCMQIAIPGTLFFLMRISLLSEANIARNLRP